MNLKGFLGPYKGLPEGIHIVFFARMINSIGNFVLPFLTIFLTKNQGLSKADAGKFVMVAGIMYALGSMVGGKLSDHFGRKKVFILCQGVSAALLIPCAFSDFSRTVPYLLIASAMFRGANEPPQMAMVTDITNIKNRKAALSFLYLGNNIGLAIGPMVAGFLYKNYLPWLFIGDAFTSFISMALVGKYIKESIPSKEHIPEFPEGMGSNERAEQGGLLSALLKRPVLLIFSAIMIIYSFVYAQYTFSLPVQVNEIFIDEGPKFYGLLMTTNALTVVFLTPIITSITMKIKPTGAIFLGGIQYAIGFGMIYFISSMPLLVLSTILWTVGEVFVNTNSGVYIANNTPISHRGRFNAIFPILTGSGFAFGPFIIGPFIDAYGTRRVWILCFILAIGASMLMLSLRLLEGLYSSKKGMG